MSTRCTIHFHDGAEEEPTAIIYRHSDGYPDGILPDLEQFFADVREQTEDTRFGDPSYLAAKYVVWQADQYSSSRNWNLPDAPRIKGNMLNFLSLGVLMKDPGDIEYRYHIWCAFSWQSDDNPSVTWEEV